MFSLSWEEGTTFAGWFKSGMPVRKMVTRSSRGASGTSMPKTCSMRPPSSGFWMYSRNWASSVGSELFQRSLSLSAMSTSFTSGMSRREILTKGPSEGATSSGPATGGPSGSRFCSTLVCCR